MSVLVMCAYMSAYMSVLVKITRFKLFRLNERVSLQHHAEAAALRLYPEMLD